MSETGGSCVDNPKYPDVEAATFTVAADGTGDFTTIAAALAALPAEGGTIFVKQGVYSPSSPILLPNAPVKIVGAGRDATLLYLGGYTFPLFIASYDQPYSFEDFLVIGSDLSGQYFLEVGGDVSGANRIICDRISLSGVERFVTVASGGYARVLASACRFYSIASGARYFYGNGNLVMRDWHDAGGYGGFSQISNLDVALYNSVLSIWTPSSVRVFVAHGCTFDCRDGASIDIFEVGAALRVTLCSFLSSGGGPRRYFNISSAVTHQDSVIIGCYFAPCLSEAVRTARTSGFFAGNVNFKVTEVGGADFNRYVRNIGFTGSILVGAASTVDGECVRVVTSGVTLDETYSTVLANASGGSFTIALPAASTCKNRVYKIKKIDANGNLVTIDPNGAETIDGAATYELSSYGQSVTIVSDGTQWLIV